MAFLNGPFDFQGSFGNLTAYKSKKTGKTVIQRKGGPTKKQVKTSPKFARTRENNNEFSACSKAAAGVKQTLFVLSRIPDFNISSALTGIQKEIQARDKQSERGQRNVYMSRHRHLLIGFNLHSQVLFDSVVKYLPFDTDRAQTGATVHIPELVPGRNFSFAWPAPYYRFVISLGVTADITKGKNGQFRKQGGRDTGALLQYHETAWHNAKQPFPGESVAVRLNVPKALGDHHTLILAIGIEPGWPDAENGVSARDYTGAGKILAAF